MSVEVGVDNGPLENDCAQSDEKWQEDPLEISWQSLALFNQIHNGRIRSWEDCDELQPVSLPPICESDIGVDDFLIPELPEGSNLDIRILSTWGDPFYVGLNGLEIFTATGEKANVVEISAEPSDMTVLPQFRNDPRRVENLLDGCYRTRDDVHLWLAPFTTGKENVIRVKFQSEIKLAMLRIWNYNKSRIHSARGVRDVQIFLDGREIFQGEIQKASGTVESDANAEEFGDTILFTTNEDILELIWLHDSFLVDESDTAINDESFDAAFGSGVDQAPTPTTIERPSTSAGLEKVFAVAGTFQDIEEQQAGSSKNSSIFHVDGSQLVVRASEIKLELLDTWAQSPFLGLTGIEVFQRDREVRRISVEMIQTDPLMESSGGLKALVDGTNVTTEDVHMWTCPMDPSQPVSLRIQFPEPVSMTDVRIWNYNQSLEDSYAGVRCLNVYLDGQIFVENVLIRKAPGNCLFDFAQDISLVDPHQIKKERSFCINRIPHSLSKWDLARPSAFHAPCGFLYQLQLLSTWGDAYYIGLNGVELMDEHERPIRLTQKQVIAVPESINVLPNAKGDVRTSDKLFDGCNETFDSKHMWLTPFLRDPCMLTRIYVVFNQPQTVTKIQIWNYAKTPSRGVKDFVVLLDDSIIYSGMLEQSTESRVGYSMVMLSFNEMDTSNDDARHRKSV